MNEVAVLILFVFVPAVMVGLIVFDAARVRREEREVHALELARLQKAHESECATMNGERERLAERLKYVEFQLANHVAHLLKLPPPAPPIDNGTKPEPLPDIMVKFLAALDDEEARGEFESDFRAQLALGIDAATIVSAALTAHA
jgi:hypothetical protein